MATTLSALVAALAYCSWPLGYLVNPSIAGTAFASDLEAHTEPFSWLFILLDCVTAVATLLVLAFEWQTGTRGGSRWWRSALLAYALFGLATGVDALIPVGCGSAPLTSCGVDLAHMNSDDVLTGLAYLALFIAAACAQVESWRRARWWSESVGALAVLGVWSLCGLAFFAGHFSTRPAVGLQDLMLTLTSAMAFTAPALMVATRLRANRRG